MIRSRSLRIFLCIFGFFVLLQIAVLYLAYLYVYRAYSGVLSEYTQMNGLTFAEKAVQFPWVRNAIERGQKGGFVRIIQETIDRAFIVSYSGVRQSKSQRDSYPMISTFNVDVSHSGESLYLIRRIYNNKNFTYKSLIVDIGANDGFTGSNSFNFIKLGWDAILVEPQHQQLEYAKHNLKRYVDQYGENRQTVTYVEAILGEKDEKVDFILTDDAVHMESHISGLGQNQLGESVTKVNSITVSTFVSKYNIHKDFGILSIDAEGLGDKILQQWMKLGFRPSYVIYEALHNPMPAVTMVKFMESYGYHFLTKRGYNYIFEYHP